MDNTHVTPAEPVDLSLIEVEVEDLADSAAAGNCFGTLGSAGCPACFGTLGSFT